MKKNQVKENEEVLARAKTLWHNSGVEKQKLSQLRGVSRMLYLRPFTNAVKSQVQAEFPNVSSKRIHRKVSDAFRAVWMNK